MSIPFSSLSCLLAFVLLCNPLCAQTSEEIKTLLNEAGATSTQPPPQTLPATDSAASGAVSRLAHTSGSRFHLPYKSWALTIHGGITHPYTDIHYRRFLGVLKPKNENQWYAGINCTHMINPAFGFRGDFLYANLLGVADSNMDSREDYNLMSAAGLSPQGIYFKTQMMQGSIQLYWNITNTVFGINRYYRAKLKGRDMRSRKVSLYTFLGAGMNFSNTEVFNLTTGVRDTSGLYVTGKNWTFVVPLGIGLKFKVTKSIDLGIEAGYHFMFTDKLDGFRYDHPNKQKEDFYSSYGITLTYKIGTRKRDREHIEWRNPQEDLYAEIERLDKRIDRLYRDSDGDGVSDVFDKDNETPEGAKVYGDGTAIDSDNDGVHDAKDQEPFSDPQATVDENGRSIDSDGDGVPDHRDLEPGTPRGNLVNFQGVTIPKQAASDTTAMPQPECPLPSIYFDYDKAVIKSRYEEALHDVAVFMKLNPQRQITIIGYCDEKGADGYNDQLGMQRALAARDYLVRVYKLDASRMELKSRGKREFEKEARDNINRRVDFVVKPK